MIFKSQNEKTIFLSLIKNGLGLSGACAKLGLSPFEVSEIYSSNVELTNQIDEAFTLGLAELTIKVEGARGTEDFDRWDKLLRVFPSKPALWGCGLNEYQLEELEESGVIPITKGMVKTSIAMVGNLRDVATSLCLEYRELIDLINNEFELKELANGI